MPILSTLGVGGLQPNLRLAQALDQALLVMLSDMATIRNWSTAGISAITDLGSINFSGSNTSRVRLAGLGGRDAFQPTAAEDTDEPETLLTDASVDISVARASLVRLISDLATFTGFDSDINPESLSADMLASYESYFNGLVGTTIAGSVTNVGNPGLAMTVDDFYDAVAAVELLAVPGPYFMLLHNKQYSDFAQSLRAEAGAVALKTADSTMLDLVGPGLKGDFLGVSIFTSNAVTVGVGPAYEGALFGSGAVGFKTGSPDARSYLGAGTVVQTNDGAITVEISRDSSSALTEITGNSYCGMSIIEQGRICGITTAI